MSTFRSNWSFNKFSISKKSLNSTRNLIKIYQLMSILIITYLQDLWHYNLLNFLDRFFHIILFIEMGLKIHKNSSLMINNDLKNKFNYKLKLKNVYQITNI